MDRKYEVLKEYFGYSSLKAGQEEIIDNIMAGRDCLGVMPTGAGKSLCFQLPALMMDGITIVISPLISLMRDQVAALVQSGVRAAFINSSLTYPQYKKALANAMDGMYKIIYIAPERLLTEDILQLAASVKISLVAVDEAHCVSQWGHDFRPHYKNIADFIDRLYTRPVVCAFTATATNEVKIDILKLLRLKNPFMITTGYNRENLYFEVKRPNSKFNELLKILVEFRSKSGIIYCLTRKKTDEVCEKLLQHGFSAAKYHAGLEDDERKKNQEAFVFGRVQIMVATNAFGMGIDKSDVSFVIHYNMPGDMESYYQEAGRAGRDGSPAKCILLYSTGDRVTNEYLIDNTDIQNVDENTKALLIERSKERLRHMERYSRTTTCLRQFILNYFGERTSDNCGNCYNCLADFEEEDCTSDAAAILNCIKSTGQRYGKAMTVLIARGVINERTDNFYIRESEWFGCLASREASFITLLIDELIVHDYIGVTKADYPTLYVNVRADELLDGRESFILRHEKKKEKEKAAVGKVSADVEEKLFEALRKERMRLAKVRGVPPFVIFQDTALIDMCIKRPHTKEEFLEISGVGYKKMLDYSAYFMNVIKKYESGKKSR